MICFCDDCWSLAWVLRGLRSFHWMHQEQSKQVALSPVMMLNYKHRKLHLLSAQKNYINTEKLYKESQFLHRLGSYDRNGKIEGYRLISHHIYRNKSRTDIEKDLNVEGFL